MEIKKQTEIIKIASSIIYTNKAQNPNIDIIIPITVEYNEPAQLLTNRDNFDFVVDTGAEITILTKDCANKLGVKVTRDSPSILLGIIGDQPFYGNIAQVTIIWDNKTSNQINVIIPRDIHAIQENLLGMEGILHKNWLVCTSKCFIICPLNS